MSFASWSALREGALTTGSSPVEKESMRRERETGQDREEVLMILDCSHEVFANPTLLTSLSPQVKNLGVILDSFLPITPDSQ